MFTKCQLYRCSGNLSAFGFPRKVNKCVSRDLFFYTIDRLQSAAVTRHAAGLIGVPATFTKQKMNI